MFCLTIQINLILFRINYECFISYGRADGCVAILLDSVTNLIEPEFPYEAIVEASSVNHGGRSIVVTAPNLESQEELIKCCLSDVHPAQKCSNILFWECHGTGTILVFIANARKLCLKKGISVLNLLKHAFLTCFL